MYIARLKQLVICIVVMAPLVTIMLAAAVNSGQPDGAAHPYVGLLIFDLDGAPSHRCSGTLLSSTVMLTAGHCTFGTSGGRVWFK